MLAAFLKTVTFHKPEKDLELGVNEIRKWTKERRRDYGSGVMFWETMRSRKDLGTRSDKKKKKKKVIH